MLIISRVCAEFHDQKTGETIFAINRANRLLLTEAPEAIRQDPLFQLLLDEGSLEAVVSAHQRMLLENDPLAGTDPSGKKLPTISNDVPIGNPNEEDADPAGSKGKPARTSKKSSSKPAKAAPAQAEPAEAEPAASKQEHASDQK